MHAVDNTSGGGLLYADRTPKMPLERIALATTGRKSGAQKSLERQQEVALDHDEVIAVGESMRQSGD